MGTGRHPARRSAARGARTGSASKEKGARAAARGDRAGRRDARKGRGRGATSGGGRRRGAGGRARGGAVLVTREEKEREEAAWRERERRESERRHAIQEAWSGARDLSDRIGRLEHVARRFPEDAQALDDIATTHIAAGDTEAALATYRRIIDGRDAFSRASTDVLARAYLSAGDARAAMRLLNDRHSWSSEREFNIALAHLRGADAAEFRRRFDRWMGKDLGRVLQHRYHERMLPVLLGEDGARVVEEAWDAHYERFLRMTPYERYRVAHRQLGGGHGRALGARTFQELAGEYADLDRGAMLGELTDGEEARYDELSELLDAELTIG